MIYCLVFFFIYAMLESVKYNKREQLSQSVRSKRKVDRIYNPQVVYAKLVCLSLAYVSYIIYRIVTYGFLHTITNWKWLLLIVITGAIFFTTSILDIKNIKQST